MPITKFLVPLTPDPIDSIAWDKSGHLFAISASANKLYVYTVTNGHGSECPGIAAHDQQSIYIVRQAIVLEARWPKERTEMASSNEPTKTSAPPAGL